MDSGEVLAGIFKCSSPGSANSKDMIYWVFSRKEDDNVVLSNDVRGKGFRQNKTKLKQLHFHFHSVKLYYKRSFHVVTNGFPNFAAEPCFTLQPG